MTLVFIVTDDDVLLLQAYPRTRNAAVQIARIAAGTVIAVTFILGFFMLASAYVSATYSCAAYNNLEALRQVSLAHSYVGPLEL